MASTKARGAAPVLKRPQAAAVVPFAGPQAARLPGALELPLAHLVADPKQPRQHWEHDEGERRLGELVGSVREFGILQPLLVSEIPPEGDSVPRYRIIAGNRRFLAAQRAGLLTVPAVVRSAGEQAELRILQLTENLQRQDLAPIDEARAFKELMDLKAWSPADLGRRLHVSDQHVRNRLRLLDDQVLADAVERRQISAAAARQIQQLPDEARDAFRERVRQGEHLQTNDLAAVRARLAAEGVIHPRRSPRPGKPLAATATPAIVQMSDNSTPPNSQTMFDIVPPPSARQGTGRPPVPSEISGAEPPGAPGPVAGVASATATPQGAEETQPMPFQTRMASATAEARRLVLDALRYGRVRGMSCAALLEELQPVQD